MKESNKKIQEEEYHKQLASKQTGSEKMKPIFIVRTLEPFRASTKIQKDIKNKRKVSSLYSAPIAPGQK